MAEGAVFGEPQYQKVKLASVDYTTADATVAILVFNRRIHRPPLVEA